MIADLLETRILPASLETERLVLGSIQLDDTRLADVAGVLETEDFSLEKHRRIYAQMKDLHARGERIDRVTLVEALDRQGQLASVDGMSYLVSLDEGLPEVVNLDSYVRIIHEKALLRQTILACQKIIDHSFMGEPSEDVLDTGRAILERVEAKTRSPHEWVRPCDVVRYHGSSLLCPERNTTGIRTPWARLTEMTGGWNPRDLIIVAGRPGMGKSVIGMQQAYLSALQGIGVAYFSLEMSKESLTRRLIAGLSRVDAHRAKCGYATPDERRRMMEAAADLETLPLYINDTGAHTPAAVSAALRKLKAKTQVGLVIIDHLQLMKVAGRAESRHQELSEICHGFKRLAGQMDCVVMVLSQLNRSCEQERRRPNLSDLKESGSIEEDADAVVFVHRPELYKRDDPSLRGQAELIVAKQRNGPTGKFALTFLHGYQVFEEASRTVEDDTQ